MNQSVLRHYDEFVRHKVLDFIGDIYLLGHRVKGSFEIFKGGHRLTDQRKDTQPQKVMTAGSTFKNPFDRSELKAWQLIDKAGLREYELSGVSFSEKHANFIVNDKGATARDIETLIKHIQNTVKDRFGIDLDTEVRIIGEYDES